LIAPLRRKVVVFAGGGTGGHLFPGLAVARALPSLEPVFLVPPDRGDGGRIGGEFRVVELAAPRVDRAPWFFPARLALAVQRARRLLRELGATAVVGLGGYASVPGALAARSLGLPLYLVECNAVPGRATRLLAHFAAGIGLGAAPAQATLPRGRRCRVTGTPLRDNLRAHAAKEEFGLEPTLPTLLVLGGSQGAAGLNARVLEGLEACAPGAFQVLHCSGNRDAANVRAGYKSLDVPAAVVDFLPDIGRAYAVADLVLSRAGASTVAECAALRRPAVFVPYPWHKDRQQVYNAWEAVRAGAARIVEEADLDPTMLKGIVHEILLDPEQRRRMAQAAQGIARPEAAHDMAAHLVESLGEALAEPQWKAELGE
jgi:UDP-N-acetylglucosamine--N-acetylmuramyl-(pentapeptide) pyrophosphoryl-undecaprenol N-acetylglucosamine transferase